MKRERHYLVVLSILALGGFFSAFRPEIAIAQDLTGKIIYQGDANGNWDLYAVNAGGRRLMQLTENSADDEQPRWSPDGQHIAFTSNRSGNYDIYVMKADGTDVRRLTHSASDDKEPAWSSDGTHLVFTSYQQQGDRSHLSLIKSDGSQRRRISQIDDLARQATWNPDGNALLFSAIRYNVNWGIHRFDFQEERLVRLTGSDSNQAAWSSDGMKIAYIVTSATSKIFPARLWSMNADGSAKQAIAHRPRVDLLFPVWSPDGAYLLYAQSPRQRVPDWELKVVSLEDEQEYQPAAYPLQGTWADWHRERIPDDVFARKGYSPWRVTTLYEAEYVPHETGKYRRDPDALNQRALAAHSKYQPGFMTYGPHKRFPAGEYSVRFRLKASDYSNKQTPVVKIDVAASRGSNSLAQQQLVGGDFLKKNHYQDFELNFTLSTSEKLEFRTWYFAKATVWLDRITVSSIVGEHE